VAHATTSTSDITMYHELLKLQATNQHASISAVVTQSSNLLALVHQFSYWTLDAQF